MKVTEELAEHYVTITSHHASDASRIEAAKALGIEIKPCPFCGSFPYLVDEYGTGYYFQCINTRCNGNEECTTREDALANWNKRS